LAADERRVVDLSLWATVPVSCPLPSEGVDGIDVVPSPPRAVSKVMAIPAWAGRPRSHRRVRDVTVEVFRVAMDLTATKECVTPFGRFVDTPVRLLVTSDELGEQVTVIVGAIVVTLA